MGVTTATAARIYGKGEEGFLAFDKFPNVGVLKVSNLKLNVFPTFRAKSNYHYNLDIFSQ